MIWPILLLFLQLSIAHPFHPERSTPLPVIRQLCEFPNVTWIENIAVRSNGLLLVTLFTSPSLYQIDPFQANPVPTLVASFPSALGILGIAEIEKDVFAITKGNFSRFTGLVTPKSWSVWKADFRAQENTDTGGAVVVSKIADLPEAMFLNGATTVGGGEKGGIKFLLMADSILGVVWRLNLDTLQYDPVLNVTATQPTVPVAQGGFGVNGVHTRDGFLGM
ncbi:hypothetical protein G7Y89_g9272 [Cudoniella acicularis]|uniref:Uncharacterized protein n=1 Tax=Cudoniella acicularis TaxID=354080 RepID=A0A8H4W2R3_9HELO|nr:hypothetical protein G7Y89_g9272 [Cudoniella acicularis]